MILRVELHCYFCGHDMGEVSIPTRTQRPTIQQLHSAYAAMRRSEQPVWDRETDRPLCPRCRGQLALALEIVRRPARIAARQVSARG